MLENKYISHSYAFWIGKFPIYPLQWRKNKEKNPDLNIMFFNLQLQFKFSRRYKSSSRIIKKTLSLSATMFHSFIPSWFVCIAFNFFGPASLTAYTQRTYRIVYLLYFCVRNGIVSRIYYSNYMCSIFTRKKDEKPPKWK